MPAKKHPPLYQLKVTLIGSKPPIWRRLLVPADISLDVLHDVLQIAMGWDNAHLHQFTVGRTVFGVPDDEFGDGFGDSMEDERRHRLHHLLLREKGSIRYEYDFGDSWEHRITLEKILPPDPSQTVPRCTAGKRAGPPEDCGGIWGYYVILEALNDPEHPEHAHMRELWGDEEIDPEHFDIDEVNDRLSRWR